MRHVGDGRAADLATTERMLREYIEHQRARLHLLGVVERASRALIGDAGLYRLDGHGPEIEVGHTLGRRRWGRGYATEAARACLDAGFRELGLTEVVAVVDPANPASLRVLDKLGMIRDGPR